MTITFCIREALESDFEFLFELKKAAEKGPIEQVFGWDENVQWQMHQEEWDEAKPSIITHNGQAIGSYLVQQNSDDIYFGRFFILPQYQGQGIGSAIMREIITLSQRMRLPIRLLYLQGNRVGELYCRHGFEVTSETEQFVYMQRPL
nr:GNAT family N-acetyltransferase [Vibrio rhodolitus]